MPFERCRRDVLPAGARWASERTISVSVGESSRTSASWLTSPAQMTPNGISAPARPSEDKRLETRGRPRRRRSSAYGRRAKTSKTPNCGSPEHQGCRSRSMRRSTPKSARHVAQKRTQARSPTAGRRWRRQCDKSSWSRAPIRTIHAILRLSARMMRDGSTSPLYRVAQYLYEGSELLDAGSRLACSPVWQSPCF